MARPLRIEYPGAFYHVMARGDDRKAIFRDDKDRLCLLEVVRKAAERYRLSLHAYCLMDNHYHLLVESAEANLSVSMRYINGQYAGFINRSRGRSGHLLQGRYKAIVVDKEAYGLELSRYIHLNPVRAGMVRTPQAYRWSSYRSYLGREEVAWLETAWTLGQFAKNPKPARELYRKFTEEGLRGGLENPFAGVVGGILLGRESFMKKIQSILSRGWKGRERDLPALRAVKPYPSVTRIDRLVRSNFQEAPKEGRKVAIYLSHRHSGVPLREIGRQFGGISESGVTQVVRRLLEQKAKEKSLELKVFRIEKQLMDEMSNV
jgi:putative transposase